MQHVLPRQARDKRSSRESQSNLGRFFSQDAREELERLRKDEQPASAAVVLSGASDGGGLSALPAQVPDLPEGLRITTEMKLLLSALLTSSNSRIAFCGMGGIGKTTISTWLVRQEGSRRQFEQIVWLTLGQEPNLPGLQALLYVQLTGSDFEGDPTPGAQRKRIYISFAMPFYTYSG